MRERGDTFVIDEFSKKSNLGYLEYTQPNRYIFMKRTIGTENSPFKILYLIFIHKIRARYTQGTRYRYHCEQ